MSAKQQATAMLSVRLPTAQARRVKSRAAAQGKSVQAVVREALDAWLAAPAAAPSPSLEEFLTRWQGSLAGGLTTAELKREMNQREFEQDRERAQMGRGRAQHG